MCVCVCVCVCAHVYVELFVCEEMVRGVSLPVCQLRSAVRRQSAFELSVCVCVLCGRYGLNTECRLNLEQVCVRAFVIVHHS